MIPLNQHKALITKKILRVFSDDKGIQSGFAGFFPAQTTIEKQVGIEVERNLQKIAVDVQRCTDPVRNIFSKSTEKLFEPPFFNEAFDFAECERYDVTFGNNTNPSSSDSINMIKQSNKRIQKIKNKILRAVELQRAQILQTGIVTLTNGDNIDFKRQAASLVALSGAALWDASTGDPMKDLKDAGAFLRDEGLSTGNTLNAIMGSDAFEAFVSNELVIAEADVRRINRIDIKAPQFNNATGMAFQGKFSAGDFNVNIWTYNATYHNASNVVTKYLDANKVVVLPEDFEGMTAYAGIPAITIDKRNSQFPQFISMIESDMYLDNYLDQEKMAHWFRLRSAPLCVPVSVDRIYTIQVLA